MPDATDDVKTALHDALRRARESNLSKLEGLSEYGLRRPMTPTGTNLLGVVKHLCGIEHAYLGETFGRTLQDLIPIDEDELWNSGDMWARPGGHIDVVRELIDGRGGTDQAEFGDTEKWRQYVAKLQAAADVFADKP